MSHTEQAIAMSQTLLQQQGFDVKPNHKFTPEFTTDAFAIKKGRSMGVLPYTDFFFLHDFDTRKNAPSTLQGLHQKARQYANGQYVTPKILRLAVPNIATIAFSSDGFSEEMVHQVEKPTRSLMGGEIHGMYLIDLANFAVYSQGISLTYIVGEARLIWGSQKEFKTINPQNRAYYSIKAIAEAIFKQLNNH
ncbi:MAG: hypothetical protein WBC91_26785 [Phototrophicaceae bacterium]